MRHLTYSGKILFLTDEYGEEGREYFTVTVQPDGARTLRAHTEMDNDGLIRDVTYTLTHDWRPEECFVHLVTHGKFAGSAIFRFFDDRVECEALTATEGRITQVVPQTARIPVFAPHPVHGDSWLSKVGDLLRGDDRFAMIRNLGMSSPLPNGGSGPTASFVDNKIEYIGEETITTPAGTYKTQHFKNWPLREGGINPPVEIWAYSEHFIPIRARWDLLHQTYELVELKITEPQGDKVYPLGSSVERKARFHAAYHAAKAAKK
jgi:hypothetical protein